MIILQARLHPQLVVFRVQTELREHQPQAEQVPAVQLVRLVRQGTAVPGTQED